MKKTPPLLTAMFRRCSFGIKQLRLSYDAFKTIIVFISAGAALLHASVDWQFNSTGDKEGWTATGLSGLATGEAVQGGRYVLSCDDVTGLDPKLNYTQTVIRGPGSTSWDLLRVRFRQLDANPPTGVPVAYDGTGTYARVTFSDGSAVFDSLLDTTTDGEGWSIFEMSLAGHSADVSSIRFDPVGGYADDNFEVDYVELLDDAPQVSAGEGPIASVWWLFPVGAAGQGYIEITETPPSYHGGVVSLQYQSAPVNGHEEPDWERASSWMPLSATLGGEVLTGMPTTLAAVRLRTIHADGAVSSPGVHKLIQARETTMPAEVRWGMLNLAGEGAMRLPSTATAVTAGDPGGHFEITDGKLRPTAVGVASWTAGKTYSLSFNNGDHLSVVIDDNALTVAAPSFGDDNSVSELSAAMNRVGNWLSGKKLRFQRGVYNIGSNEAKSGNQRWRDWFRGPGIQPCVIECATSHGDSWDWPMLFFARWLSPASPGGNFTAERLRFIAPEGLCRKRLGRAEDIPYLVTTNVEVSKEYSNFTFRNCVFGQDLVPARFGTKSLYGATALNIKGASGGVIENCLLERSNYACRLQGDDLVFRNNEVRLIEGDFLNIHPDSWGASERLTIENNYCHDYMGNNAFIHSDGTQVWLVNVAPGDINDVVFRGNIFMSGYEGMRCPPTINALIVNHRVATITTNQVVAGPSDDHTMFQVDASAGPVTITAPAGLTTDTGITTRANAGFTFAVQKIDASPNTVTVALQGLPDVVLAGRYNAITAFGSASWSYTYADVPFQGLFGKNDRASSGYYSNFSNWLVEYNIFTTHSLRGIGIAGMQYGWTVRNNTLMPNIPDDWTGDGPVDSFDGFPGETANLGQIRLSPVSWDSVVYRNVCGNTVDEQPRSWSSLAYGNLLVGNTTNPHTNAWRSTVFAGTGVASRPFWPQTRQEAIDFARMLNPEPSAPQGAVGPTDDAPGYWNFTTGSMNALLPLMPVAVYPGQGETVIPLESDVLIMMNDPIIAGTGNISLVDLATGVQTNYAVGSAPEVMIAGGTIDLDIPTLIDGHEYEIRIDSGALVDRHTPSRVFSGAPVGKWRFTAMAEARPNMTWDFGSVSATASGAQITSAGMYRDASAGTWVRLSSGLRMDTSFYADPYYPPGGASASIRLRKPLGGATMVDLEMRRFNPDATVVIRFNFNDGSTTLVSGSPLGYGAVEDPLNSGEYRVWISMDLAGVSRYWLDPHKSASGGSGEVEIRDPMIVDALDYGSPYVPAISLWVP